MSLTSFVDALGKRLATKGKSAPLEERVRLSNSNLDEALVSHCYGQNTSKQEMIVAFHGQGSVREAQQFATSTAAAGKLRYALRYLGPYLTANNSLRVEGTKRLEAINRN